MRNEGSSRNAQRPREGDRELVQLEQGKRYSQHLLFLCSPLQPGWLALSSGVTGTSPNPLLSKDPPRSVFHVQYATPDWCLANVLQDVTQPVLLQEPSPNPGSTIPSFLCLPLVVPL